MGNKYPVGKIIRFCTEQANRPQFVDKFDFILFSSNLKLLFPFSYKETGLTDNAIKSDPIQLGSNLSLFITSIILSPILL